MKVWVLTIGWQYDSGDDGTSVIVYDNINKAIVELHKQVHAELKAKEEDGIKVYDFDRDEFGECDWVFSWSKDKQSATVYEEGHYAFNHVTFKVEEKEIL